MLHLQAFILSNPENFRELLKLPPYCIDTKEDEHTVLFKYNQIESDFNLELVRECRGIILYKKNWMIACHPFHKFGNYGEGYAPDIDWNSAKVMEKLDGSLIKAWFNKVNSKWQWSTNGTINALETPLGIGGDYTFGWLILYTLGKMYMKENSINE